ncbi:MAG: ribonuclease HI family protein [Syntrophorhabdaceae bacterium]|nr:ribonuclease HI family protein [Syntrophorhabdaceae bacterium]MDD4479499.1 ribonuclease HI family protein [Mesotoga sp.]
MHWHVHVDGASSGNPGKSGAGIIARDDKGNVIFTKGIFLGEMTNNMAEYEALLHALTSAVERSVKDITVYTDSQLVANQVTGVYKVKNMTLFTYVRRVKEIVGNFEHFTIQYIPREQNRDADKLAKDAILKG